MSDAKIEDYVKAIYQLGEAEGGEEPVPPSAVAEVLGVTTPTVTATMKRLEERGLVEREAYTGARLTEQGERMALETIRHHRLLELFLTEHFEYDWSEVHEEADRLEHHISERFETELVAALDDPTVDPHGSPIPTADLELPAFEASSLTEFAEGDTVRFAQVGDRNAETLSYLADAGITPGATLEIVEVAPFGMITVVVDGDQGGGTVSLPESIAATVRVREPDADGEAETDGEE
jgi:DtxR family Mn-dependent transcriptional regulator